MPIESAPGRLKGGRDWFFITWIALEIIAMFIAPGLPVLVAGLSLLSRLRTDKRKQIAIWIVGVGLSVLALLPLLVIWGGFSRVIVQTG